MSLEKEHDIFSAAFWLPLLIGGRVDGKSASNKIWLPGATGSGPYDVATAWTTAFAAIYPEADVTLSAVGSGAAQAAMWGEIDCQSWPVDAICAQNKVQQTVWGMGDAPIDPNVYVDQNSLEFQQLPACAGAVVVMYSKEVTPDVDVSLNFTFDVLSGIFNTSITQWNDPLIQELNTAVTLPDDLISELVRADSSGQTWIRTNALNFNVPSWPDDAVGKLPKWPLGDLHSPKELVSSLFQSRQ